MASEGSVGTEITASTSPRKSCCLATSGSSVVPAKVVRLVNSYRYSSKISAPSLPGSTTTRARGVRMLCTSRLRPKATMIRIGPTSKSKRS